MWIAGLLLLLHITFQHLKGRLIFFLGGVEKNVSRVVKNSLTGWGDVRFLQALPKTLEFPMHINTDFIR